MALHGAEVIRAVFILQMLLNPAGHSFRSLVRPQEVTMAEHTLLDIVCHASTWSIIWGILLIVFGMLASRHEMGA
jgi:hypothetical protein